MKFEFATATRIIFGAGMINEVAPIAADMGQHAMVVTGSKMDRAATLIDQLNNQDIKITHYSVTTEPTTETALSGVKRARGAKADEAKPRTRPAATATHRILRIAFSFLHSCHRHARPTRTQSGSARPPTWRSASLCRR